MMGVFFKFMLSMLLDALDLVLSFIPGAGQVADIINIIACLVLWPVGIGLAAPVADLFLGPIGAFIPSVTICGIIQSSIMGGD